MKGGVNLWRVIAGVEDLAFAKNMPNGRLNAEERSVIARARSGAKARDLPANSLARATPTSDQRPAYPAGASAKTLKYLGEINALLHAPPTPPRWALLRALSLLEEDAEKRSTSNLGNLGIS